MKVSLLATAVTAFLTIFTILKTKQLINEEKNRQKNQHNYDYWQCTKYLKGAALNQVLWENPVFTFMHE